MARSKGDIPVIRDCFNSMNRGLCFTGELQFGDQKQLTDVQWTYLRLFTAYRHCQVREHLAEQTEDPVRTAAGLPLGPKCCFFLDSGMYV